jgi:hypothetical protein
MTGDAVPDHDENPSAAAPSSANADSDHLMIESNGPGSFSGPFVDSPQALVVLAALLAAFAALSGLLLRRHDVT